MPGTTLSVAVSVWCVTYAGLVTVPVHADGRQYSTDEFDLLLVSHAKVIDVSVLLHAMLLMVNGHEDAQ